MLETIRNRVSTRSYNHEGLSEEDTAKVKEVLLNKYNGVFGHSFNISFVNLEFMKKKKVKRIGTYGMITGKPSYILSTAKKEMQELLDYGYCIEWIILNLTKAGLETCWLGGTFNKRIIKKVLFSFKKDVFIPGVIAMGHHADKKNYIQKMINHSHQRKDFEELFYNETWDNPLTITEAGNLLNSLEAIRLAPSDMNSQPWRILKKGHKLKFFLKDTKNIYFKYIDIGIAMSHFDLIRKDDGIEGEWVIEECLDEIKGKYIVSFIIKE